MRILHEWIQRLRGTLIPGRRDGDLEEELRLHLEMAADEARRRGLDRDEALRDSTVRLGSASLAMDALRDQRGLPWLDDFARDVRHGLRSLRRSPAFTLIALMTLALGIGVNTAIFSIVNGVVLRPLAYPKPGQLMYLTTRWSPDGDQSWVSAPEYFEFRQMNRSFSSVGAYGVGEVDLAGDTPRRVRAAVVDADLMRALAIQPVQGRLFTREETEVTGDRPLRFAMLSYEVWQTSFGGRPMVGQTVEINHVPREVVGVMPPGASLMDYRTEIWLPLGLNPSDPGDRNSHGLFLVGRLRDGTTQQAAQTELDALLANWGERAGVNPKSHLFHPFPHEDGHILQMEPLQDEVVGDAGRAIWMLQATVGFVLLIACANLANLLLARAETRQHEFAVRTALGAGRGRLLRQFTTEGILLSLGGGLLGVWLAILAVRGLILAYPTSLPRATEVSIDASVLLFTLAVATATGLLFGLAPIMMTRAERLLLGIKQGGGARTTARRTVRRGIVVAEVALTVILVAGAGLLVRTVLNLTSVDAGFEPSRLVTFSMRFGGAPYPQSADRAQAWQRLLDKLRAIPGVESATAMSGLPPAQAANFNNTDIEDYTATPDGPAESVDFDQFVMSDYFETMGIPIVAGRSFERTDLASENPVVVINETLANRFWAGRDPVGRRLRRLYVGPQWYTIIGVARDVKQGGVDRPAGSELFFFVQQPAQYRWLPGTMNVVLRTTLPPASLAETLQRVVKEVDPAAPIARLREMDDVFDESIGRQRLLAQLVSAFAALALLLAAIGTYGLLSYMVAERRREIGIRIALGAVRGRVIALVMTQGMMLTVIGLVVGLAGSFALNQTIASLLFGVEPNDAVTITAVIGTTALVAAVACWLPAFRASRLNPNVVLRAE